MSIHTCNALIISCIDFRLQKYIRKWLDKNMEGKTFDYVAYAGASKDLPMIMQQLAISVRLHHISEVVFMNHEDCGAYGKAGTKEKHFKDLKRAKQTINKLYPKLQVDLYYLHLDGEFERVK